MEDAALHHPCVPLPRLAAFVVCAALSSALPAHALDPDPPLPAARETSTEELLTDTARSTTTTSAPELFPGRLGGLDAAGSDRRQLGRYATNFGLNLKGVLAPANARLLLLGAGLAAGASLLDGHTVSYFDRHSYSGPARAGANMGRAAVIVGATAGLFGASLIVPEGRFRDVTYDLTQAMIVNTAYTFAIKKAVGRVRPDGSDRLSFPSGHTSTQFAAATVLGAHYGKKVAIPAYAVASFVGASRMASKSHHLSDVVAGAALGYVVGRTVVGNNGGTDRRHRLVLGPAASPSGDGVGLSLSLAF